MLREMPPRRSGPMPVSSARSAEEVALLLPPKQKAARPVTRSLSSQAGAPPSQAFGIYRCRRRCRGAD